MKIAQGSQKNNIFTWKLIIQGNEFRVEDALQGCAAASSLDEISTMLPQGAYSTFRTYLHNRILRLDEHIQRLIDSAERVKKPVILDPILFRAGLREIILRNPYPEARIRVTLDLENEPGSIFISLEQLHTPPDDAYVNGVKVHTHPMHRENAKAKLTGFIHVAAEFKAAMPADINEILMLDEGGHILEGLSSNFFGIAAGKIFTVDEGVLSGITRSLVMDIAVSQGIELCFEGVSIQHLSKLDECFITSASRAILPVVQIDHVFIKDGRPGPITRRLMSAFDQWLVNETQEI